jgi:TonB family protein
VAAPQSNPFRSRKKPSAFDRNFSPQISANSSEPFQKMRPLDSNPETLSWLKEVIAAGDHPLDSILDTITDCARRMTGASGAALATWKAGVMVCRARSGDKAPALGAELSQGTGISGECLRSGKIQSCADTENDPRVDLEVCRSLRLRSMAVLPICGEGHSKGDADGPGNVNGILEVFSTEPAAFDDEHIALLEKLAALAERARASHPEDVILLHPPLLAAPEASATAVSAKKDPRRPKVFSIAGVRFHPLQLAAMGVLALALLALSVWLGWWASGVRSARREAAQTAGGNSGSVTSGSSVSKVNDSTTRAAENLQSNSSDTPQTAKSQPSGNSKPATGDSVTLAAKVDVAAEKKTSKARPVIEHSVTPKVAAPSRSANSNGTRAIANPVPTPTAPTPEIRPDLTAQAAMDAVLSRQNTLPSVNPVMSSKGVSGGQLLQSVQPDYPAMARSMHMEGSVILSAWIMEDGTVRDVKVVEGSKLLAPAALDAVRKWRYKPFELNGKPVKNQTRIKVDFKF